jgi:hypothetical protein
MPWRVNSVEIPPPPMRRASPGFANKKYGADFYVEARRESTETYHLRDFKLHIDSQDSPRRNYDNRAKRESPPRTNLSQSEHDWAFAKRALARGDDPEEVIQQIAQHRAHDKSDPQYYAQLTVRKAQTEIERAQQHNPNPQPAESTHDEKELGH